MDTNERIRQEMTEVQTELKTALQELQTEMGSKLKPADKREIEQEFQQLDILLDRLKTGLIWIALFGKTSVGKSAIANSLIGADLAKVGIEHDLTTEAQPYEKFPWMIVDVPGIMGTEINEEVAIEEAKKAHGHVFVIEGEPHAPEMKLFDLVHSTAPDSPKIVFVNKWDVTQMSMPLRDQEIVKALIEKKMAKFVKSPKEIVYGSARLNDMTKGEFVRQDLPQLLERLYEDAGTLGMVTNILDPANRAVELGGKVRDRITAVRTQIARRVISYFGTASIAGGFIPFNQLILTPGILAGMVLILFRIMGRKIDKPTSRSIAKELLKACGLELGAEFTAAVVAEGILSAFMILGPIGALLGAVGNMVGLGYFRYRRTVILGEVTIEFINRNCTWEGQNRHDVFVRCKERAAQHYLRLRSKNQEAAEPERRLLA